MKPAPKKASSMKTVAKAKANMKLAPKKCTVTTARAFTIISPTRKLNVPVIVTATQAKHNVEAIDVDTIEDIVSNK